MSQLQVGDKVQAGKVLVMISKLQVDNVAMKFITTDNLMHIQMQKKV